MKYMQLYTKEYRHEYTFDFNGVTYPINIYVKLTEEGKTYLNTKFNNVKLIEHFYMNRNSSEIEFWKFVTRYVDCPVRPFTVSTDKPLEDLIDEVILPNFQDENIKQNCSKVALKDWEVPDVLFGWICFIVFFIVVGVFKEWLVKYILRISVGWWFGLWRQKRMIEEAKWKNK